MTKRFMSTTVGVSLCVMAFAECLENESLKILFADGEYGFAVTGIVNHLSGDARFVHEWGKNPDFWRLAFSRRGADGSNVVFYVDNHKPCLGRRVVRMDNGIDFHWDGIDIGTGDWLDRGVADVTAHVRLDPLDGMSRWTLSVANRSPRWALYETEYPSFSGIVPEGGGDVLRPCGALAAKLSRKTAWPPGTTGIQRGYPGYYMMLTAYNQGEAGLYIAAHDPDCREKMYVCNKGEYLRFRTVVENAGVVGKAADGPRYPVVIGAYRGDWWTAAKIYRKWARGQKWARKGMMAKRADYPRRMAESHLWMLMNGSCAAMSNVLAKMAKEWPDVNKAIEWTCWNFLPFDCSYPEFLPPRDGWSDTLAYAKSLGIMTMPYTNGRLWDKALASYHQFAEPWMCHDANGDVWSESWRQKKSHFGVVCPSWKTYHDILLYAATNIVHTYGAGSLYIDQVACSRPKQCFSPSHGHALGGGTHWRDGYHRAMERVHGALSAEGAPLMSEGMGEAWLDVIDGYLNAYMPHPDQVPLFTAVYSGYATAFGCRMGEETPPDAFFAMQARSTLWGCAPGWCLPWVLEPKYKAHADALYACGRVRQAAAEFLAWGTLEGEVRFDAPLETKQYSWFEMKHGKKAGSAKCELPCVSGNIWKNAEGTEWAVALVNISDVPRNVSFALPCIGRFSVLQLPWQEEPAFRQDGSHATAAIPARSFAVLSTIHSKEIQK